VGKPLSVLQIEDREDDALLVLLELQRAGYDLTAERVETPSALTEALKRRDWDVVISDYSLPGFNGMEALKLVQACGKHQPFIIVSGAIGEETAVELMRSGAQDCIMKDNLSRLPPAVERELGEAQMRREREEAIESLRRELKLNTTLAEVSRNLIALPGSIDSLAAMVLNHAKELTESEHGYVAVIDVKSRAMQPLTLTKMHGALCFLSPEFAPLSFPMGADGTYPGLWGVSLNTKTSFFDNAPARHPAAKGLPEGHIPVDRFLSVPVLSNQTLVGQISLANSTRDYTAQDITTVERLGALFSIAVSNHRNLIERETLSAQVRQMQKMEALGTLAEGIAHDFNNILMPMMGYAELAQMSLSKDSKVWRHMGEVLKACNQAKELVQQILTLSRQTEERRTPMPLHPIIQEALRLLRSSIPSTIEIRQDIDKSCGPVLAVSAQIHQVVMNLCTNAYHAMRDRGGVLSVTMKQIHVGQSDKGLAFTPGDYIRLDVSDTGQGMEQSTMEKIFDPYFTTKKKGEGTGLGLSIVQGIVRKHGGHVSVYSEPGIGSTFHVYLPVAAGEAVQAKGPDAGFPRVAGEERVIVVDDVAEIVEMAKEMLGSLGYDVSGFTSSTEALAEFSRNPNNFDLLVTDMTMPNLTGLEICRMFLEIRPDLPVILCSGLSENIGEETIEKLGIRKLLKKPITFQEYSHSVRQVLDDAKKKEIKTTD
jgi:signal transduction histidine kinase/DNA-binding response OmpR family regulator